MLLSNHMTEEEIKIAIEIIEPGVKIWEILRHDDTKYISVYVLSADYGGAESMRIDLLTDDVYIAATGDKSLDGVMLAGERLYRYRQLMIARGYSGENNPYV